MMKIIVMLFTLVSVLILKVNVLHSSEYIQDVFKIKEVYLLPEFNISNQESIQYNYLNNDLYVLSNEYTYGEDSISFILYKSETNNRFKEYNLIIPKEGFSERMHISDIYIFNNKLYLLEFSNLIEFEISGEAINYKKDYKLKQSCTEILNIDSNEASLTLNFITSDVFKDKTINFICKINLDNNTESRINFDNSKNYKLINVGPRKNKVFMSDSVCIFSDITNYKFNIETREEIKEVSFDKKNWKLDNEIIDGIKVDFKNQKNSLSDLMNYNLENSSIYGLFKINDFILVRYAINSMENKENYFDILEYNTTNNSLSIVKENIRNYELDEMTNFGVDKFEVGRMLKVKDNYLLELAKFPFPKEVNFKDKEDMKNKIENNVIENGARYSIIVREMK